MASNNLEVQLLISGFEKCFSDICATLKGLRENEHVFSYVFMLEGAQSPLSLQTLLPDPNDHHILNADLLLVISTAARIKWANCHRRNCFGFLSVIIKPAT